MSKKSKRYNNSKVVRMSVEKKTMKQQKLARLRDKNSYTF